MAKDAGMGAHLELNLIARHPAAHMHAHKHACTIQLPDRSHQLGVQKLLISYLSSPHKNCQQLEPMLKCWYMVATLVLCCYIVIVLVHCALALHAFEFRTHTDVTPLSFASAPASDASKDRDREV